MTKARCWWSLIWRKKFRNSESKGRISDNQRNKITTFSRIKSSNHSRVIHHRRVWNYILPTENMWFYTSQSWSLDWRSPFTSAPSFLRVCPPHRTRTPTIKLQKINRTSPSRGKTVYLQQINVFGIFLRIAPFELTLKLGCYRNSVFLAIISKFEISIAP